jgi:glycosyltransferase involved in cell wall biosynthesis
MYLSVIIPTHNRKAILERCIQSLLNQSLSRDRYEIIIVDDGSTDGTGDLINDRLLNEGNIIYLRQEGKGPAAARNLGIKNAGGEVIFFTGDDIIADRDLLKVHYQEHANSDVKTAILGLIDWHPELKVTEFMRYLEKGVQFSYHVLKDGDYVNYDNFVTANVSLKKVLLLDYGIFDEDFRYPAFEDTELALRLNSAGMKLKYVSRAKAYHYHPVNLKTYSKREYLAGQGAALFYRKHPEQAKLLGTRYAKGMVKLLKYIIARILIKPLELFGGSRALYSCYSAVSNYHRTLGFNRSDNL